MKLDDIHQVAVRLFARQGYAATGIRELGRDVGLNSATLYHYAGAKEELLAAIMRACLEELSRAASEAMRAPADTRIQLARLVHAHVGVSALNPSTCRVTDQEIRALGAHNRAVIVAIRDDHEALFADVIGRGALTRRFQVADRRLACLALLEMCNGVANWYRPSGRLTVAQVQERYVEFACRLVGTEPVSRGELGEIPAPVRLLSEPADFPAPGEENTR